MISETLKKEEESTQIETVEQELRPLFKKDLIIRRLQENPNTNYSDIAKELNTTRKYVTRIVQEAKKQGLLPKKRLGGRAWKHRRKKR